MGCNRLIFLVLALVFIGGTVALCLHPGGTWLDRAIVVGAMSLALGLTWRAFRPLWRTEAVLRCGLPAEAVVLKVWDTGTAINDDPQVGLRLEVRPVGDAPFQAETVSLVPRLDVAQIRPGAVLQVKYDSQDRRRVALVPSAELRPARQGAAGRLQELEALRERGLVTPEEYERKHREIVDAL